MSFQIQIYIFSNGFNLFLVMGVSYYCFSGKVLIFNVWVQFLWPFVWLLRKRREKKFLCFLFIFYVYTFWCFYLSWRKRKKWNWSRSFVKLSSVTLLCFANFFFLWVKNFPKFYSDFFVLPLFSQRPNIAEFYVVSFSFLIMWVNVYVCFFLFLSCFLYFF